MRILLCEFLVFLESLTFLTPFLGFFRTRIGNNLESTFDGIAS